MHVDPLLVNYLKLNANAIILTYSIQVSHMHSILELFS